MKKLDVPKVKKSLCLLKWNFLTNGKADLKINRPPCSRAD